MFLTLKWKQTIDLIFTYNNILENLNISREGILRPKSD